MQRLDFYKANPEAMKPMMVFEQQIAKSNIEKPLIELMRLRASQINGCAYCVDLHSADARKAGEEARRLAALVVWREAPFFSPRERAALAWTESLTLISENHVPDAVWQEVESQFSASELVELTLVVNTINAWNRLAIAFRKLPS
jgi:AhpD family alkylhydroperoxidase